MTVYQAINNVAADLGKSGIAKERTGTGSFSYKFRGIDDVYAALSPLLAMHKLCILPNVLERTVETHTSAKGNTLFYVTVKVKFDIVSSFDGTIHSVTTMGEAMDSGDKATNKAMSAAYKYMAFMTFCIPTEGDNDTENMSYEVVSKVDAHKELKDMATMLAQKIDMCRSQLQLTELVTSSNPYLLELKQKLPSWFDKLMVKINENQEAFRMAEAS